MFCRGELCSPVVVRRNFGRANTVRPYKNIRPFEKCYSQAKSGLKVFAQLFSKSWRSPEAAPLVRGASDEVPAQLCFNSFLSNFF